jgi:hypothetical protein
LPSSPGVLMTAASSPAGPIMRCLAFPSLCDLLMVACSRPMPMEEVVWCRRLRRGYITDPHMQVRLWNTDSGCCAQVYKQHQNQNVSSSAWMPDSRRFVVGTVDRCATGKDCLKVHPHAPCAPCPHGTIVWAPGSTGCVLIRV